MEHIRRSPRAQAISVRNNVSPSIASEGIARQRFAAFAFFAFASRAISWRMSAMVTNANDLWSALARAVSHSITSGASRKLTGFVGAMMTLVNSSALHPHTIWLDSGQDGSYLNGDDIHWISM
jgi:hypothetical protein